MAGSAGWIATTGPYSVASAVAGPSAVTPFDNTRAVTATATAATIAGGGFVEAIAYRKRILYSDCLVPSQKCRRRGKSSGGYGSSRRCHDKGGWSAAGEAKTDFRDWNDPEMRRVGR